MANAMLEEGFKDSHPDLVAIEKDQTTTRNLVEDEPMKHHTTESKLPALQPPPPPSPKKSVDFSLEPPLKKAKTSDPWTAKQVVDAISTCISRHERLEAIRKARDTFDHDVQSAHDEEMGTGADAALAKHLTFVAYQAERAKDNVDDMNSVLSELSMTCDAMESLYRASSDIVGASFRRMGNEVMEILVNLINEEINRRFEFVPTERTEEPEIMTTTAPEVVPVAEEKEDTEEVNTDDDTDLVANTAGKPAAPGTEKPPVPSVEAAPMVTRVRAGTREGDTILRKATKIVGHFARVGDNTRSIAHFPGLLGSFIRLITVQPYDCIPWEARLSALWTIANLACNSENMQMMVCTPGLIGALVDASCRPLHPGDDLETIVEVLRSRSIASRAILNLSWAPENKIILADHAAVIDFLSELSVHRSAPLLRSRTVREILLNTRRHAVSALRNLAAAPRRTKISLCEYRNGHLLDVLTDAALNDTDPTVKDRSFAAIHNLAIQDTAQQIVNHPSLVLALRGVLLSDDDDTSPKSHASATLMVLERTITPEMESYESLRELIDAVNPSQPSPAESDSEMEVMNATAV